jgi:16S rRNA U1498 N3-methylase RsmE
VRSQGGGLASGAGTGRRIVVAVGPEGGWEDDEVQMLAAKVVDVTALSRPLFSHV